MSKSTEIANMPVPLEDSACGSDFDEKLSRQPSYNSLSPESFCSSQDPVGLEKCGHLDLESVSGGNIPAEMRSYTLYGNYYGQYYTQTVLLPESLLPDALDLSDSMFKNLTLLKFHSLETVDGPLTYEQLYDKSQIYFTGEEVSLLFCIIFKVPLVSIFTKPTYTGIYVLQELAKIFDPLDSSSRTRILNDLNPIDSNQKILQELYEQEDNAQREALEPEEFAFQIQLRGADEELMRELDQSYLILVHETPRKMWPCDSTMVSGDEEWVSQTPRKKQLLQLHYDYNQDNCYPSELYASEMMYHGEYNPESAILGSGVSDEPYTDHID